MHFCHRCAGKGARRRGPGAPREAAMPWEWPAAWVCVGGLCVGGDKGATICQTCCWGLSQQHLI